MGSFCVSIYSGAVAINAGTQTIGNFTSGTATSVMADGSIALLTAPFTYTGTITEINLAYYPSGSYDIYFIVMSVNTSTNVGTVVSVSEGAQIGGEGWDGYLDPPPVNINISAGDYLAVYAPSEGSTLNGSSGSAPFYYNSSVSSLPTVGGTYPLSTNSTDILGFQATLTY